MCEGQTSVEYSKEMRPDETFHAVAPLPTHTYVGNVVFNEAYNSADLMAVLLHFSGSSRLSMGDHA